MVSVLKKLGSLLDQKQKFKMGALFLITVFGAFLEVIGVSLMLPLVSAIMDSNIITNNQWVGEFCEILMIQTHKGFVLTCITFLIIIFIFKNAYLIFQYYLQAKFVYDNQFTMQKKLLHIFLLRPYEFFLNADSGEMIRVIQNDVSATYYILITLIRMISESIVSFAIAVTIFLIDPFMMIFISAFLGIIVLGLAKAFKPVLKAKGTEKQEHGALTYKWLIQAIDGIKEIKVTEKSGFFLNRYAESGRKYIDAEKANFVLGNIPRLVIEMTVMCSVFLFIAWKIYSGQEISSLIPILATFGVAALKLLPSANRIMGAINIIAYGEPALDKLIEDVNWIRESENEGKAQRIGSDIEPMKMGDIEIRDISYRYPGSSSYVLKNASMTIKKGTSVGIVGKSGSGKTTVVDLILGLLEPESGAISVNGENIKNHNKGWLKNIGYIPQSIFLLDDSIRKNVAFGQKEEEIDDDRVRKALEKAELGDLIKELPEGVHTQIGEKGIRLSGGQRQRIGIARVLYREMELLIFDEATAALDNETEASIMKSIEALQGEKTMIMIAHRLQTIEHCDVVYRVQEGKIRKER